MFATVYFLQKRPRDEDKPKLVCLSFRICLLVQQVAGGVRRSTQTRRANKPGRAGPLQRAFIWGISEPSSLKIRAGRVSSPRRRSRDSGDQAARSTHGPNIVGFFYHKAKKQSPL